MKNLCVITPNYPFSRFPEYGAFVEKHVNEWEQMGVYVDIVAPISIQNFIRSLRNKKELIKVAGNRVERPFYPTVSNKNIGPIDLYKISKYFFFQAAMRGVKKLNRVPELFYGKFLLTGGVAAFKAGKKYDRPAFLDLGESCLIECMSKEEIDVAHYVIPHFEKIFCVSQRLVDEAIELGAHPDNVVLEPNTVDTNKFSLLNKGECRKELGLPQNEFIVIFVGHFIERKGPLRVLKAINSLNGNVKGVFLGKGKQQPEGQNVLFADSVPNDELSKWLNAADLFVLPTLAEGYCNAINEAMACGLPIVTSDIKAVKLQVPDNVGILVNPKSCNEISSAIERMYSDGSKRKKFGQNSRSLAIKRSTISRANKILKELKNYSRI